MNLPLLLQDTLSTPGIFSATNWAGWVIGGLIGIILGMLLTPIFYPRIEDWVHRNMVKWFNQLPYTSKHKLAGKWTHRWHVVSSNFPPVNEIKDILVKQYGKRIFAEYQVKDNKGKSYTYQMYGIVDKEQIVTGTWKDVESGHRYHGCFQLHVDINEQSMNGYWTGISNKGAIKSDKWEWIRE
jgi:hypothetical protein